MDLDGTGRGPSRNLAELFYVSARHAPHREALVWEGGSLTYAGLRDWVESLRPAFGSSEDDVSPFAAVLAHRSPAAFAAVQAILAQGKAYVPLNPRFPAARNAYILSKARIATVFVGEECAEALSALLAEWKGPLRIVALDSAAQVRTVVAKAPEALIAWVHIESGKTPAPLAPATSGSGYVLFTSGSTGQPKGVRVTGENVFSYLRSFQSLYTIHPEDRVSQTFDMTFDLSAHDQFSTWNAGATLVVFPEKALFSPLPFAAAQKITVWFSVPALAAFLENARQAVPGALPGLRLSLFAGEKLTWKTYELWKRIAPNTRIANLYGPTEATIAITHFEVPDGFPEARAYQGGIPIGRTFPGQSCEVRREDGSPCAPGEVGGLWLAGDQVAAGYVGEARKTAERFVPRDGTVWYRTGDLVLMEPDGILQYLGREDFQVKVMGYRIELGEIEHALMNASGAAFSIADVAALRGGMEEIYGVLPAACAARRKEIKSVLKEKLPTYMVPRHLFFRDDIPLNGNGKMDRNALKARLVAEAASAEAAKAQASGRQAK